MNGAKLALFLVVFTSQKHNIAEKNMFYNIFFDINRLQMSETPLYFLSSVSSEAPVFVFFNFNIGLNKIIAFFEHELDVFYWYSAR